MEEQSGTGAKLPSQIVVELWMEAVEQALEEQLTLVVVERELQSAKSFTNQCNESDSGAANSSSDATLLTGAPLEDLMDAVKCLHQKVLENARPAIESIVTAEEFDATCAHLEELRKRKGDDLTPAWRPTGLPPTDVQPHLVQARRRQAGRVHRALTDMRNSLDKRRQERAVLQQRNEELAVQLEERNKQLDEEFKSD